MSVADVSVALCTWNGARFLPEQVRSIEATRAQMNESLQRVSYAHALLSL